MTRVFLAGGYSTDEQRILYAWAHTALTQAGYDVLLGTPERHTEVAQMVGAMAAAQAALETADVVATVPEYRKGWAIDAAQALAIPVFPAAHLVGWTTPTELAA